MHRLALFALTVPLAACGSDPVCGPADDALDTLPSVDLTGEEIIWQDFRSSPNNDCGETGGPTSLTLEASQTDFPQNSLVLCLPRPDKLSGKTIEVTENTRLRIIDVFATPTSGDCLLSLDRTRPASGTVAFHGVCDDGLASEGYSLDVDMSLPTTLLCGQDASEGQLDFKGSVKVSSSAP